MATNITRWSPDTCGCVIEYSWDSEASEDERVHEFHKVINQCTDHDGIETHPEVHDHVLAENQTKNVVLGKLLENVPRLKKGDDLDPAVKFDWQFQGKDKERQLKVNFVNAALTKTEKSKLTQSVADLDKNVSLE